MGHLDEKDFFSSDLVKLRRTRSQPDEPSLVPIIDMMTTIIIFLVLTTSFVSFTKHTLPPSGSSIVLDSKKKPIQPQLYLQETRSSVVVKLKWEGSRPSESVKRVRRGTNLEAQLVNQISSMMAEFKKRYPQEKSLQLGLTSKSSYQLLVSAMDGAQPHLPDIVLVSFLDVDRMF